MTNKKEFNVKLLMLTTLIISGCSIIYEVLISSISSYLVGDSIKQFSITIGLYMSAMGLGSYLSKYLKKHLFDWFVFVEIGVGIIGGVTAILLFFSYVYIEAYALVMYVQIIGIGVLVGLEIPLLTRIIEDNHQNLRVTLSTLFSFDYIGGLIGSIAFPLLLLPQLGYFTTSALTGCLNIVVALIIVNQYRSKIKRYKMFNGIAIVSLVFMFTAAIFSENIASNVEGRLYRDQVIYSNQTHYQNIVMTKHKDDLRLFIDGNLQFSASDEYRYHEALIHVPMLSASNRENVLILGGGDGLAAREILKYNDVKQITLVDLDKEMVELCKNDSGVKALNKGSLSHEKMHVEIGDAYKFLETSKDKYDVIIIDLPDPNNETLNKLYTNIFYRLAANHLKDTGAMSIQSTSPYYAKKAYWCIYKTVLAEGFVVTPYHVQVPSFGDWGFQLVTKKAVDIDNLKLTVPTQFLNDETLQRLFIFSEDEKIDLDQIETNTLSKPKLISYYLEAVNNWR